MGSFILGKSNIVFRGIQFQTDIVIDEHEEGKYHTRPWCHRMQIIQHQILPATVLLLPAPGPRQHNKKFFSTVEEDKKEVLTFPHQLRVSSPPHDQGMIDLVFSLNEDKWSAMPGPCGRCALRDAERSWSLAVDSAALCQPDGSHPLAGK